LNIQEKDNPSVFWGGEENDTYDVKNKIGRICGATLPDKSGNSRFEYNKILKLSSYRDIIGACAAKNKCPICVKKNIDTYGTRRASTNKIDTYGFFYFHPAPPKN